MNCRAAREILNSVFDGDEHVLTREAHEHLRECAECREWHSGMERTLELVRSSPEPDVPDIAAAVMRRLPAVHPAALHTTSRKPAQRAIMWLAACWLLGLVTSGFVGLVVARWFGGGSITTAISSVADAFVTVRSLLGAAEHTITTLARAAVGFESAMLWVSIPALAGLIVGYLALRARYRTVSACIF